MAKRSAIVIGAGIVGIATARALAGKGFSVKVFDRTQQAIGASIRNFGMIWPIGQPSGKLYERALRTRSIWKEISSRCPFWHEDAGSLHLAYHPDEWKVLQELYELFKAERPVKLLTAPHVAARSEAVVQENLLGGLFSADDLIIDPREAMASLPRYMKDNFGIEFYWGKCVSRVSGNTVHVGHDEEYGADIIIICSGSDFETLYPELYREQPITKCKLQMMRLVKQPGEWRIGPALCGGLSLIHYKSFRQAASLPLLKHRYETTMSDYMEWGIHVMVSQNGRGELTIGDSHEYGLTPEPFDREVINRLIMDYLFQFSRFKSNQLLESWNGVYAKLTDGSAHLFFSPEPGVYIINGLGGAGMTLSFGLAEELVEEL